MPDESKYVHYFRLYARTAIRKPVREYRFDDLEFARVFVLRFLQKHAPDRNAEAVWAHISSQSESMPGHIVLGNMAKVTCGFLLNFGEVGPYPSYLDIPPEARPTRFDGRPETLELCTTGLPVTRSASTRGPAARKGRVHTVMRLMRAGRPAWGAS